LVPIFGPRLIGEDTGSGAGRKHSAVNVIKTDSPDTAQGWCAVAGRQEEELLALASRRRPMNLA
jgi:hypothetical protein